MMMRLRTTLRQDAVKHCGGRGHDGSRQEEDRAPGRQFRDETGDGPGHHDAEHQAAHHVAHCAATLRRRGEMRGEGHQYLHGDGKQADPADGQHERCRVV